MKWPHRDQLDDDDNNNNSYYYYYYYYYYYNYHHTKPCTVKRCHFIYVTLAIFLSIFIAFAPIETRMNTTQSNVIYLLNFSWVTS